MYAENKDVKLDKTVTETKTEQTVLAKEAQKAIKKIQETIEAPYQNKAESTRAQKEEQYNQYKEAIDQLGKLITAEQASVIQKKDEVTLEEELAAMAYSVTNSPKILEELIKIYRTRGDNGVQRGTLSPKQSEEERKIYRIPTMPNLGDVPVHLEDIHCVEKYRHAWEYLLLAPRCELIHDRWTRDDPVSALRRIANIATVPLCDYFFTIRINSTDYRSQDARILYLICNSPKESSLNYLLKGLALCRVDKSGKYTFDYFKNASGCMSIEKHRDKWKTVIVDYPKDKLPAWQKEFLDQVLVNMEKQKVIDAKEKLQKEKETKERIKRHKEEFIKKYGEEEYKRWRDSLQTPLENSYEPASILKINPPHGLPRLCGGLFVKRNNHEKHTTIANLFLIRN